jgi:hypothetical protein
MFQVQGYVLRRGWPGEQVALAQGAAQLHSSSRCASVSMPSATTALPSEAPSSTMALTTATSLAPPCRRLTKLRSIFRLSMGSVDRWLRLE